MAIRKNGALATDPIKKGNAFVLGNDAASLNKQLADQKKKLGNSKDKGRMARIAGIEQKLGALGTNPQPVAPQPVTPPPPTEMEDTNQRSNDAIQGLFGQISSQGTFNPGDFAASREKASQSVMDSFNRNMQPQFQQEEQQFRQQMAEQGIPETSELYQRQFNNLKGTQNNSRLNAQNQAFLTGQSEQAQGYNQASDTFNMPYSQLGQLTPFYQEQNAGLRDQANNAHLLSMQRENNAFTGQQNSADRNNNRWLLKNTPRGGGGGGGLNFEQQQQLQRDRANAELYNSLALMGAQNGNQVKQPGAAGGFIQGVGAGIGAGLGAGLRS